MLDQRIKFKQSEIFGDIGSGINPSVAIGARIKLGHRDRG